jgi:hypothetical protein
MARAEPLRFAEFTGINNVAEVTRLKRTDLREAVNVDIDETRAVKMREGHAAVIASTTNAHSGFEHDGICLYRRGTSLYRLNADHSSTVLKTGLTDSARMGYAAAPGRIFMGDGFSMLQTDGETVMDWGLTPPAQQPVGTATVGQLPAGKYLYAVTFLRADGEESGTPAAGQITLTATGGIAFAGIPVSAQADAVYKAINISKTNGKKLFRALVIPNATTSTSFTGSTANLGVVLETQFLQGPPPGRVMLHFNGRMLVSDGKYLWYNPKAYQLERFSPLAVRPQTSIVAALAGVDDGVFVLREDAIDFHAGADFAAAAVATKAKYGGCFGGVTYVEGDEVGLPGRVAVMVTRKGICLGGNGGSFKNVTDGRYSYTEPQSASVTVRDVGGFAQMIAVLRY